MQPFDLARKSRDLSPFRKLAACSAKHPFGELRRVGRFHWSRPRGRRPSWPNRRWVVALTVVGVGWAAPAAAQTWNLNGNGNWGTAANWTPTTVPNAIDASATLGNIITVPRTVTLDIPITIGTLNLSGSERLHGQRCKCPDLRRFGRHRRSQRNRHGLPDNLHRNRPQRPPCAEPSLHRHIDAVGHHFGDGSSNHVGNEHSKSDRRQHLLGPHHHLRRHAERRRRRHRRYARHRRRRRQRHPADQPLERHHDRQRHLRHRRPDQAGRRHRHAHRHQHLLRHHHHLRRHLERRCRRHHRHPRHRRRRRQRHPADQPLRRRHHRQRHLRHRRTDPGRHRHHHASPAPTPTPAPPPSRPAP